MVSIVVVHPVAIVVGAGTLFQGLSVLVAGNGSCTGSADGICSNGEFSGVAWLIKDVAYVFLYISSSVIIIHSPTHSYASSYLSVYLSIYL